MSPPEALAAERRRRAKRNRNKRCRPNATYLALLGWAMKIIAFIERHQTEVIETILRHCGWWEESPARSPPASAERLKA